METTEVRSIVKTLAQGIDPTTGKVFPQNSPYNDPKIIRALFKVVDLAWPPGRSKLSLDGVQIATSLADLTDGRPVAPINVSEFGDYVGPFDAWTATAGNGQLDGDGCADWTSTDPMDTSLYGRVSFGLADWTQLFQGQCGRELHLYCLANEAPVLFADGFESGTTVAWSATVPATP